MTAAILPLQTQVARVRRRLIVQTLLGRLAVWWFVGTVLATLWLLAEPFVRVQVAPSASAWLTWPVVSALLLLTTVLALRQTLRRSPSRLTAALALDERFALRERVTTTLSLNEAELASPAGQALAADAAAKVAAVSVAQGFPLRWTWRAALPPIGLAALVFVGLFYQPNVTVAEAKAVDPLALSDTEQKSIEQKLQAVVKKKPEEKQRTDAVKSEKLKQLESELDRLLQQQPKTRDDARELTKKLNEAVEEMKKTERKMLDKQTAIKEQLDKLSQLGAKQSDPKGPAKNLQDALTKNDAQKAKEEIETLRKKLKSDQLSDADRKQLQEQLKDLQAKLDRLSRNQDAKDQLKKLADDGKIDQDTLERELDKLDKQAKEQLKDLKNLADKFDQAQKALKDAEGKQGAEKQEALRKAEKALSELADQLDQMDADQQTLDDLQNQLQRLNDAKDAAEKGSRSRASKKSSDSDDENLGEDADRLSRKKDDDSSSDDNGDGDGDSGQLQGEDNQSGNGSGRGGRGRGAGRRPDGKLNPDEVGKIDQKQKGQVDPKGKKRYDGAVPGQATLRKPSAEVVGKVRQASQAAAEAIETQRIPRAARDMVKDFFRNLGNQNETPKPKP